MLGSNYSLRGWWGAGTDCPEKPWMPHPWRCSGPGWMGPWAAWFRGRCPWPWWEKVGTRWLLRSLPAQPKPVCDSMTEKQAERPTSVLLLDCRKASFLYDIYTNTSLLCTRTPITLFSKCRCFYSLDAQILPLSLTSLYKWSWTSLWMYYPISITEYHVCICLKGLLLSS